MRFFGVISASLALLFAACGDKKGDANYDQGKNKRAESLDKMLRGEMAAVDTYNQAITRFGSEPGGDDLRSLRQDHQDAVAALTDLVTQAGGKPSTSPGVWGDFAKVVTATAKLAGNDAAFTALRAGEQVGIRNYEDAGKDANLTTEDKRLIQDTLLPKARIHLAKLDELKKRV
jgi:hypothetical protein